MPINHNESQSIGMRQHVYYRGQWMSNLILCVCVGIGIAGIQFLVDSVELRSSLTLLFVIVTVIAACAQLLSTISTYSRVIKPLEFLRMILDGWTDVLHNTDPEALTVDKVRDALQSMDVLVEQFKSMPTELKTVQIAYYETLKMLQAVMEKTSGDSILMGLGNVCSQVAHDIRGPVAAISALATAIPKLKTEEEQVMASEAIAQSAAKLATMAEDLLDYRRATQIDIQPMDLSQMVQAVICEVGAQAQQLGVTVEHDIQVSDQMRGDATKLTRVVQNLVQNSVQALRGVDGARVRVKARQTEDQIFLSVTDNGPGIPEAHMGQMFKKGFTTKGRNGTGLGLIYCETVVRGHGGQISACNLPEGGAQIQIALPCPVMN